MLLKKHNILKIFIMVLILATILQLCVTAQGQSPITRGYAEERALEMINFKWYYSKYSNGIISSKYKDIVWQPSQLHGITYKLVRGIPYNWGGFDSFDSRSDDSPWTSFPDAMNKGAYAGNVNTDYNYGYIPGTAGIDCSGFIQATFNIKSDYKLSTSTMFDKYFYKIKLSDIKHMDILNKSAWHVAIFDRWGTYKGKYGAFTYESTSEHVFGGIEGTKRYFMTMDEINSGYVPGRYINIVETPPLSTAQSVVKVGSYAKITNVINEAYFRKQPAATSPTIGTIPVGTALYLEDVYYGWYKVTYNGMTGWISGQILGPIPSGIYAGIVNGAYKLNIRSSPSLSGTIIGLFSKGDNVQVLGHSNDKQWWKIRYDDVVGWASSYYLKYIF